MSNSAPEVFLVNLRIGDENLSGGINCTMNLRVTPSTKKVQGYSLVSQAINPPLLVDSIITGNYQYLCTNEKCRILINLNGYYEDEDTCVKNFEARILLEDNWAEGVANYTFYHDGQWMSLSNQQVKAIKNLETHNHEELAKVANN
jgi:hypothetical protein